MVTTIDELGRVALPKELRDDLGLKAGTVLRIEEKGSRIILQPIEEIDERLALRGGILVFTGKPEGSLDDLVERTREERIASLLGRDPE